MQQNSKQQGAALIISLMLLLTLSLASLGSLKMAILEEKMARNHRDQQIAFQRAEAVLVEAEHFVLQQDFTDSQRYNHCTDPLCFSEKCTQGLCRSTDYTEGNPCHLQHNTPWQERSTWANAPNHRTATYTPNGRYIIEFRCFAATTDETEQPAPRYRITALATGGTSTAQVMLQSTLQLPPPTTVESQDPLEALETSGTPLLPTDDQHLSTLRPTLRDSWRQLSTLNIR